MPTPGEPRTAPFTVLIVDDEPQLLDVLSAGISRAIPEARVLTAVNAAAGLDVVKREPIDLVLSDQRMPGEPGIDFIVKAKRVQPSVRLMMITAYGDLALATRNINEARVSRFFTKPFRLSEVVHAVRDVLAETRATTARERAFSREMAKQIDKAARDRGRS